MMMHGVYLAAGMALMLLASSFAESVSAFGLDDAVDAALLSTADTRKTGTLTNLGHESVKERYARQLQAGEQEGNGDAPTPSPDDDDEALSPSNGRTLQATAFKWSLDHAFHSASRMLEETTVVAAPAPAPILVDFPGGGVQVSDQGVHVQFPGGAVNIGRKLKALTVT